jgi:hypothetical protein
VRTAAEPPWETACDDRTGAPSARTDSPPHQAALFLHSAIRPLLTSLTGGQERRPAAGGSRIYVRSNSGEATAGWPAMGTTVVSQVVVGAARPGEPLRRDGARAPAAGWGRESRWAVALSGPGGEVPGEATSACKGAATASSNSTGSVAGQGVAAREGRATGRGGDGASFQADRGSSATVSRSSTAMAESTCKKTMHA